MKDTEYYSKKLSSTRLKKCYDIANPRIRRFLQEEINNLRQYLNSQQVVLELGCGYGRVLKEIVNDVSLVVGIDKSRESIDFGRIYLKDFENVELHEMNAESLNFDDGTFDIVLGIQNSLSAFKVDMETILREAVRVTKKGGKIILSTYSEKFWDDRLQWFIDQSNEGLLGEIDFNKTGNGEIICKDGFVASTISSADFQFLTDKFGLESEIYEVDDSTLFCVISI